MTRTDPRVAAVVPTPVVDIDVRTLPIGPLDAFILSRVDGRATDAEIAMATGMVGSDVQATLARLANLGAVVYRVERALDSSTHSAAPRSPGGSGTHTRVSAPVIREAPTYDEAELEAPADLELDRKRIILDTFHRLPHVTHYELLRVPDNSDKKAIKGAYYDIVGLFHPDKYFGKNLGDWKPKLERIFTRITEAHDTLTKAAPRAEYDRYLESQRSTRALDGAMDAHADEVETIRRELEREARLAESVEPKTTPVPGPIIDSESLNGPVSMPHQEVRFRASLTPDERRRALARKLGASIPPASKPHASGAPLAEKRSTPAPGPHEAAASALRRRYEARLSKLQDERIQRYVVQAETAIVAKKHAAAINAVRIARSLSPTDPAVAARLVAVENQANEAMAEQYLEQARYDERRGHFAEAALAYERVLRGRPTAKAYERAAHCLLESRGDFKKAGELAKKAVELAPTETAYRITLARVYAQAGMEQSALGELERARTIDPTDDTIKDWIKRFKRGET